MNRASMPQPAVDPLAAAFEQHRAGNLPLAETLYRELIEHQPRCADAWHLWGALCLQQKRFAEAVELISRAITLCDSNADFYSHLGAAQSELGQHDQAIACLRRAVQLAPQSSAVHYNLGTALLKQGRREDAIVSFRHAVAADPNSAIAHYNLANTLGEVKQLDAAVASYREALRARPGYVKAMINLGNALREQRQLVEAIELLQAAVAGEPEYAGAHLNLGVALRDAGKYQDSVDSLRRAVALDPDSAEAHNNLGTALQSLARFDEALACYEEALRLNPELPEAHFSRATHRLRQGDVGRGFEEYEWRWRCKTYSTRQFAQPRWDGSPLAGRTILLHAEQGLGDTLQFVRYAAAVKQRGGHVILECQAPLTNILASSAGIDRLIVASTGAVVALPQFDVHCPLMSLPGALNLTIDQLAVEPYLAADPQLMEKWRAELAGVDGLRVGIAWQGNRQHLFDAQRSFQLEQFAPAAQIAGVRLISLQKGPGAEQAADCGFELFDLGPRLDETTGAFMDTAAVMRNLDLVITSDTAVAHLAGALGVPVWVALSAHGDWRWFVGRDDSPWYPTMRLFRQRQLGDWDEVFARITTELRALAARAT